jgi:hypothetical protein
MFISLICALTVGGGIPVEKPVYLNDLLDQASIVRQGWGVLGQNVCAHDPGQQALKLQIGSKNYEHGLGSHAAGVIAFDLLGKYSTFDAEVGVQKQDATQGSVIFRVELDGKVIFDSGVMYQTTPPKPVHLNVEGGQELALIADPAGDGITNDCADWCDARLMPSAHPKPTKKVDFDIAPFATVCTWDPKRMDGARATRIEEYHAEDVFLDQPVPANASGGYSMPKTGCVGLLWLDRRRPAQVGIEFAKGTKISDLSKVQVQAWVGTYPFQGNWKALVGDLTQKGNKLSLKIDYAKNPDFTSGFRKVRWVLPRLSATVEKLTATSPTSLKTLQVHVQYEGDAAGKPEVETFNAIIDPKAKASFRGRTLSFKMQKPNGIVWGESAARPALRVKLPIGGLALELDDLINDKAVYFKDQGVFISTGSKPASLEAFKKKIATKKTVLERVRTMPDQTFAQAMTKTYREDHNYSPLLLSLGEDNWKWLFEVNSDVVWMNAPEPAAVQLPFENRKCLLQIRRNGEGLLPELKPTIPAPFKRWMPVDYHGDQGCRIVSYVAPVSSGRSVLLMDIQLNSNSVQSLDLPFFNDRHTGQKAQIAWSTGYLEWLDGNRAQGALLTSNSGDYKVTDRDGSVHIEGSGKGSLLIAIPGWDAKIGELEKTLGSEKTLSKSFADYWLKRIGAGMKFEIPDKFLQNIILSSVVRCIVDTRTTHEGKRYAPWIAETYYGPLESEANTIVRGMGLMGYADFTKKSLDYFAGLYNKQGFLTTGYTVLGTGWHLWTMGEFLAHSPDNAWLKGHQAEVTRVCKWVIAQRRKTMKLDPLGNKPAQYGLFTPGVIADWNAFQYYFYTNGMYCEALATVGKALKAIGDPFGAKLIKEASAYRTDIIDAYRKTQAVTPAVKLQDGTYVPGQPSQVHCPGPLDRYYAGDDASRTWAYDVEIGSHNIIQQRVFPANGVDAKEMSNYLEDVMFLKTGWGGYPGDQNQKDWFNLGGFGKVQPYYGRMTEIYAMRDDVKPFIRAYFNMIASLVVPSNLTIWEHFDHYGAPDKTHETGVFLQQTRFMLLDERGSELWLAPFVTSNWMQNGMEVAVEDAPTVFGPVSYRLVSSVGKGVIEAFVTPPTRLAPKAIVLRVRHPKGLPMKSVTVNGKRVKTFDVVKQTIRLTPGKEKLHVVVKY